MDLGLLDDVRRRNRKPIGASERECFYQLLAAVGGADRGQLERLAQRDLELPRLLQDPASRQGRLVLVQAAARRVTEILVGDRDLRERFGLERYYQIDGFVPLGEQVVRLGGQEGGRGGPVFANHFPATFCVRRLPPEMARLVDAASRNGSDLNESIQVAGYFFKLWAHQSEYVSSFDKEELQLSPLFIGLEPQLSLTKRWHSPRTAMACGLAFVAALAAIWYGVWRFGRSDRGFLRAAWKQRARRQRAESDGGPDVEAEDRPDLRRLE
jgi:hypothetical protein